MRLAFMHWQRSTNAAPHTPTSQVHASVQIPSSDTPQPNDPVQRQIRNLQSTMLPDCSETGLLPLPQMQTDIQSKLRVAFRRSSPLKIQFPTFRGMEDSTDPLLFLEKCRDFLAVHPLTDSESTAMLRNVLHGTARDWWDVAHLEITTSG